MKAASRASQTAIALAWQPHTGFEALMPESLTAPRPAQDLILPRVVAGVHDGLGGASGPYG